MSSSIISQRVLLIGAIFGALACGSPASLPVSAGMGPDPTLPSPRTALIPLVNVAEANRWHRGETPLPASGLDVQQFAAGLDHPRWLYVLPNGDVLVAETNAPKRPDDGKGIAGFFFRYFQKKAGGGVPSANRITLLRDSNGDGVADSRSVLLTGLNSPFGMALVGNNLYVANSDALMRFTYTTGTTHIADAGARVTALPGGPINHHWTKSLIASPDGSKLYVGVGSNSNAAENGIAVETDRAAVWEIDAATGAHRIYASGLRNPVGMAWEPTTRALWVAVNERDELGGDLVPDYMTAARQGGFYGWPYSYFGNHEDERVKPQRPDLVATAIVPDYALGNHTASLGLAYGGETSLGTPFRNGMFVGQHGSWNRKPRSGYKVIFVPFINGKPGGNPIDVLAGFVSSDGEARGRPVGVAFDNSGALLVADDVGNTIWRVRSHALATR
ncbi:MAG: sorbosone dehydrogenase family protein [Gemmatimonadaceae bacterium]